MTRRIAAAAALLGILLLSGCARDQPTQSDPVETSMIGEWPDAGREFSWRQWGGPDGDFRVDTDGLADSWPPGGPPLIWERALGEGYSSIVYERGVLFTIYRENGDDVVVALRGDNGATVWEYRYPFKSHAGNDHQYGSGPNATPLILEDRIITLGFGGTLNALDLRTGRLLWSLNLVSDLGGQVLDFGNSSSPIRYEETVIVLLGGPTQAVAALDPDDGSVVWRSGPGRISYGTPMVIHVDGQDQLVFQSEDEIIGLDPGNGTRLWSHPSLNVNRDNISPPIWGEDGLLWTAMQPEGGTRVLKLKRTGGGTEVREIWSNRRVSIHYWNALRLDGHVYASIGGRGNIFACVNVRTGKIEWRKRGFERANLLQAGDKTILMDSEGELALVRLSPEGLTVLSRATVSDGPTWTIPALAGTTLYVRDQNAIRAFDLASRKNPRRN
jgi:outer membrane protein assembly factor BamB